MGGLYYNERTHFHTERKAHCLDVYKRQTQLKVVLVKPERFEDASTIADHLNNKRTVVLLSLIHIS